MAIDGRRFNTYVMVPHVHSKDFAQGDNVMNPGPAMDAAFKASASFPVAGQFGIVLNGQGGFPEAVLFRPSGGSGGRVMAAQSGGGGMGELFDVVNNTPSLLTRGVSADVMQARTANATLVFNYNGVGGILAGTTALGLDLNAGQYSGWSAWFGARLSDKVYGLLASAQLGFTSTAVVVRQALNEWYGMDAVHFGVYLGAVERFRVRSDGIVHPTQGNGETFDSVPLCFELPITVGLTINPGDTTKWDPATPGRVIAGGASALQPVGICVVGGLGDAPGSVKAVVFFSGYKAILVSDGAITQFRRIKPGVVANRWADGGAAAIAALQHSPAVALQAVGASGLNFKAFFDGTRLYV